MAKIPTKNPPKRPTRDEFELEEIAEQLAEAQDEKTEVYLTVWGWEDRACGRISNMDSRTKMIHLIHHGDIIKVPFMDIMRVSSI